MTHKWIRIGGFQILVSINVVELSKVKQLLAAFEGRAYHRECDCNFEDEGKYYL